MTIHGSAQFRVLPVKTEEELDALQVLSSQVAVRLRGVQGQRGTKRGEPHDRAKADKEEGCERPEGRHVCMLCMRFLLEEYMERTFCSSQDGLFEESEGGGAKASREKTRVNLTQSCCGFLEGRTHALQIGFDVAC
jgi:hypothetical protein